MELIRDIITVKEIDMVQIDPYNPSIKIKNKMFSKVSRIFGYSNSSLLEIYLDINTEIYPICLQDKLDIMISNVPAIKNNTINQNNDWVSYFGKNTLDLYEYVVYGTVFHSGKEKNNGFVYASFGGLLMKLFGFIKSDIMEEFSIDSKILLLIRKV
jgi:DNA-directed RNA polymerases I, II, and III subunit RPABC3